MTEEANRFKDKHTVISVSAGKVNLVESGGPKNFAKFKGKGKLKGGQTCQVQKKFGPGKYTKPVPKIYKSAGAFVCYVCGKLGHKSYQCT